MSCATGQAGGGAISAGAGSGSGRSGVGGCQGRQRVASRRRQRQQARTKSGVVGLAPNNSRRQTSLHLSRS